MITNLKWGSRGKNFVITAQSQFVTKKIIYPISHLFKIWKGQISNTLTKTNVRLFESLINKQESFNDLKYVCY
jgi:hypothetical protein